ncbi:fasciclin domain-containing protein [Roseateles sp. DC23W]|uniref:Fasciclin domain-containing protein n=1 Tax=Pelomonas dachongensis TaxID=3299029 RepID=A0ABW7EKF8_9BURK
MSLLLAACGGGDDDDPPPPTIAEVAQQQGFTALLAASTKAGLSTTLADPSAQLTVFAPTNAAFGTLATQLGFASADAMVTALPADALASLLRYHVLGSKKMAADLSAGTQATLYSFGNAPATLTVGTTGGVTLQDAALTSARVVTADVQARNGVVHVVDKVLVPPGVLNIVQMAQVNTLFEPLVAAVVKANLQGTLSGAGPFTVFAPTRDAFNAVASVTATLSNAQLANVLTYHVLAGQVLAAGIPFGTAVPTVLGQQITINAGTPPTIRDSTTVSARITATDVRASNGVIHVIDKVLIPNPI